MLVAVIHARKGKHIPRCAEVVPLKSLRCRKRRGAAALWTAASMAVMLGFAALAIDTGRLYVVRSELQVAADAAATGACTELGSIRRGSYDDIYRAAECYAA